MNRYRHEALLYAGEDEFLALTGPFLQDAVAVQAPTFVVLPAHRLEALKCHVDGDADLVSWADMAEVGRNPARIIAAWHDFVAANRGAVQLRGIGEPIYRQRSAAEIDECHRHEALLNVAIPDHVPLWLLCPYNVDELDRDVIAAAHRTHPVIRGAGGAADSEVYEERTLRDGIFADPAETPPPDAVRFDIERHQLGAVRRLACAAARRLGVGEHQLADFALVVAELISNTIRHGGGHGSMQVWRTDHAIICQTQDSGHPPNLLAGRLRPDPAQLAGRGLWLVNQLCDLLQIRASHGDTVVTAHVGIMPAARS